MTLREQIENRMHKWAEFNRWEAEQPPIERDPRKILADLGAIWRWLPTQVRSEDPDPEKHGVQRLRAAFVCLSERP